MKHTDSVYLNGSATVTLASNANVPPGERFVMDGPLWLIPRPMKLHRLHFEIRPFFDASDFFVHNVKFNNKTAAYGPLPGAMFLTHLAEENAALTSMTSSSPDRWAPWFGHEIDQNTKISIEIENQAAIPMFVIAWFTTGPLTGRPFPDEGGH